MNVTTFERKYFVLNIDWCKYNRQVTLTIHKYAGPNFINGVQCFSRMRDWAGYNVIKGQTVLWDVCRQFMSSVWLGLLRDLYCHVSDSHRTCNSSTKRRYYTFLLVQNGLAVSYSIYFIGKTADKTWYSLLSFFCCM